MMSVSAAVPGTSLSQRLTNSFPVSDGEREREGERMKDREKAQRKESKTGAGVGWHRCVSMVLFTSQRVCFVLVSKLNL